MGARAAGGPGGLGGLGWTGHRTGQASNAEVAHAHDARMPQVKYLGRYPAAVVQLQPRERRRGGSSHGAGSLGAGFGSSRESGGARRVRRLPQIVGRLVVAADEDGQVRWLHLTRVVLRAASERRREGRHLASRGGAAKSTGGLGQGECLVKGPHLPVLDGHRHALQVVLISDCLVQTTLKINKK